MTEDRLFLRWLNARLRDQYNIDPLTDYMQKLIAIAEALPPGVDTPVMSPVPADSYYMPPIKYNPDEVLIAFTRKNARRIHKAADELVWAIGMSSAFLKMPKRAKPDEIVFTNDEYHINERTVEPPPAPDPNTDPYIPVSIVNEIPVTARFAKLMNDAMNKREDRKMRKAEKRLKKALADTPNLNSTLSESVLAQERHDAGLEATPFSIDRAFKHFQSNLQARSVNELGTEIHTMAKEKGWYDADPALNELTAWIEGFSYESDRINEEIRKRWPRRNLGEQLFLIVSELAEAFEEYRAGRPINEVYEDDGKPEGVPVEIADAIIRILDLTAYHGIKVGEVVRQKMDFNATRPHRHGGKLA